MGAMDRLIVGHVNYLFFHSTQSFIYFYLSHGRRARPICLTRGCESAAIDARVPAHLADDFYTFTADRQSERVGRIVSRSGIAMRRGLISLPPRAALPALDFLERHLVPRLRVDSDPRRFLDWAQAILERRQADLIHAYYGPVGWLMLECRRRLGIPLVVSFLGDDVVDTLSPWWSWWTQGRSGVPDWPVRMRELFEQADLLLVEGPFLRDRLLSLGCPREKVQVQRIAIPLSEIPFRRARPSLDGRTTILFAGRFCAHKGLLYALDAVRRLRDERRNVEFRVIGDETMTDGSYASSVYSYIRANRLEDCVRLLGFMNRAQYLRQLQEADLYLHPSIVDDAGASEGGAPTTILEAQAAGIPVVSTQHCDIPHVTRPGLSAMLVPEKDGEALAEALRVLLDDPERWEQMGRAGREHVARYHDIVTEAPRLEERYLALVERTQAKRAMGAQRSAVADRAAYAAWSASTAPARASAHSRGLPT
jgi:colanic acid/amylovoran biosynthesis glycosyltransferase